MVSASEAAEEYRSVLSELTRNDKTQINLLTILAEDYASYSSEIVKVIDELLHTCSVALKICMLYVVDSIIKNIPVTGGYRALFAEKIVDMIVHVFKESDEKTRHSLYRVRCTWTDIFPKSKLYMIDTKIHGIDPAWPIQNPSTIRTFPVQNGGGSSHGHVVHVNPRFLNGQAGIKPTAAAAQPPKSPIKRTRVSLPSKPQPRPKTAQPQFQIGQKRPRVSQNSSQMNQQNQRAAKPPPLMGEPHQMESQPPPSIQMTRPSQRRASKPPPLMGDEHPRTSQPPPLIAKQSPPPHSHGYPQKPKTLEPTAALGAHAFDHSVVTAKQQSATLGASTPPQPLPHQLPPQQAPLIDQTVIKMDTSAAAPQASVSGQPMIQQTPPNLPIQQSPMFIDASAAATQHNIQNVTPRLSGVPENNRIFVDGKAYEVFYLDQAAVIERNGLPHRVSFAGPPRDVIIDGIVYRMAFGEQKQVVIDGDVHILRFGAPSRELYMGNYPFRGAFGGPPIIATVNGRRHEIRLCGPAPEVRIDPEPTYELMRYMPAIRQHQPQQQQFSPKVEPQKEQVVGVTSLLKRLQNSGIFSQVSEAERRSQERHAALEAKGAAIGRSNSPPVPCSHRLDHIERRATPMAGFDQFSMRSLIIRYDSVIDSLHRQRKSCQHCGIGFQQLYGEAYQRHVDWHLQDTLKMKDPRHKYTRSQPWYMLEDWFNYSETELVNRIQNSEAEKASAEMELAKNSPQDGQQTATTDVNRDAPSESIELKECQVCHEQFEEYWDEDEDIWRLRDCIVIGSGAVHSGCQQDDSATPVTSSDLFGQASEQEASRGQEEDDDDHDMRTTATTTTNDVQMDTKPPGPEDEKMEEKEEQEHEEEEEQQMDIKSEISYENKRTEGGSE